VSARTYHADTVNKSYCGSAPNHNELAFIFYYFRLWLIAHSQARADWGVQHDKANNRHGRTGFEFLCAIDSSMRFANFG
jgi:hypothetical protein